VKERGWQTGCFSPKERKQGGGEREGVKKNTLEKMTKNASSKPKK